MFTLYEVLNPEVLVEFDKSEISKLKLNEIHKGEKLDCEYYIKDYLVENNISIDIKYILYDNDNLSNYYVDYGNKYLLLLEDNK